MFSSKLTLLACVGVTVADVYMHNPRGSNNRLNEQSANRNNGNRMFDSQVRLMPRAPSALCCDQVKWASYS